MALGIFSEARRKWWTLAAVSVGIFMIMLDNTVVNVALPSIQRELGADISSLQWIVTGYALAFAALMLIGGKLADAYGRRRLFVLGIVVFTLASLAIAIALGKILISIISAFAIVYFRFPGRNFFFWMIFVTLMLPIEVRIIPTFKVASDLGLLDSYAGLTLPLIASATGGLADMIRDGESGLLVPPGDAAALHAAIARLLDDPGLGAHDADVERQAQVGGRARHALEVLVERVRPPAVEAHDLEDAVAAQQPLVGDGQAGVGERDELPVEAGERHDRACYGPCRSPRIASS